MSKNNAPKNKINCGGCAFNHLPCMFLCNTFLILIDTENKANLHSKKSAIIQKALSPDPVRYSTSPKYMLCEAVQQKLEMTNVSAKIFCNRSEVTRMHGWHGPHSTDHTQSGSEDYKICTAKISR